MMKCTASSDPSILGAPLCGLPATFITPLGTRCGRCADRLRDDMRHPDTLLNVIHGRPRTEEEIAKLIQPLTE